MGKVRFPVVMHTQTTLPTGRGQGAYEMELRVARSTSVLLARPVGAGEGAWQSWASWDTPVGDPVGASVGASVAHAAELGVTGFEPVPRPPLTGPDVVSLHAILQAASQGTRVARLVDAGDEVAWGTARHIVVDEDTAAFPNTSDDVRDCVLRVTLASGFEAWWPVADLVRDHQAGVFVTDYQPPATDH
jgi:hypothetical protein